RFFLPEEEVARARAWLELATHSRQGAKLAAACRQQSVQPACRTCAASSCRNHCHSRKVQRNAERTGYILRKADNSGCSSNADEKIGRPVPNQRPSTRSAIPLPRPYRNVASKQFLVKGCLVNCKTGRFPGQICFLW